MTRPFVILDRDGTLIEHVPYLSDPDAVVLLPGVSEALRSLRAAGLGLVVVTNQSGIGRGYFHEDRVQAVHARLRALLSREGAALDGIYYCPHTPSVPCACRKPGTWLATRATREHPFDPARAAVVGDNECDVALGAALGAATFLVRTGYGARVERDGRAGQAHVVDDLGAASHHLMAAAATRS